MVLYRFILFLFRNPGPILSQIHVTETSFTLDPSQSAFTANITYGRGSEESIDQERVIALINNSGYCSQKVVFSCQGASLNSDGSNGVILDRNGEEIASPWGGVDGPCAEPDTCQCLTSGSMGLNEAIIEDKSLLPITGLRLDSVDGPGSFLVGSVECRDDLSNNANVVKAELYREMLPVLRTCSELYMYMKAMGIRFMAGYYKINPNPMSGKAGEVYCESDGRTVVGHNHMGTNAINETNMVVELMYKQSARFMVDLESISGKCEQYVKATCRNMPFFNYPPNPQDRPEALATWTSLDDIPQDSWGTEDAEQGCPCFTTPAKCLEENKLCNCDAFPGHESLDEIFLMEPAKAFNFTRATGTGNILEIGGWECNETGESTSAPYVPIQKTCSGVLEYLMNQQFPVSSGFYWIDPDEEAGVLRPFFAYCDFYYPESGDQTTKVAETVIYHDYEDYLFADKDGLTQRFRYSEASIAQIAALSRVSEKCEQMIEFNCKGSPIWSGDIQTAWWTDRHGNRMVNWGGVPTGEKGCACKLSQEGCVGGAASYCNCDANDTGSMLYDGGILNDKSNLPVTSVTFGRSADNTSFFRVSPLRCSGQGGSPLEVSNKKSHPLVAVHLILVQKPLNLQILEMQMYKKHHHSALVLSRRPQLEISTKKFHHLPVVPLTPANNNPLEVSNKKFHHLPVVALTPANNNPFPEEVSTRKFHHLPEVPLILVKKPPKAHQKLGMQRSPKKNVLVNDQVN
nr:uncharacterized protein LOC129271796 [Lytechinus pictus]